MTTHRASVCLSLDFDATSAWLARGSSTVLSITRGEFGATTGAQRILDLCQRLGISSTWYVPGQTADQYPEVVAAVAAAGHEIANHGYLHEDYTKLTSEQVRTALRRGNDALQRVTGIRPTGLRTTGDFLPEHFELFVEEGFRYSSSIWGEYVPRWARAGYTVDEEGRISPGPELDLVELPVTQSLSDACHFEIGPGPAVLVDPRRLEQIWRDEFEYLYEREPGGYLMLMLHPESIGYGARMLMLERFLDHCAAHEGVRFVTAQTLADEFRVASSDGPA
ncbi:MAG: polysaccharide deacetylase family protein [Actinobacteria bacterium]|nr:polysaccharide deacetylase family protein [Actinomycetota bacterium]